MLSIIALLPFAFSSIAQDAAQSVNETILLVQHIFRARSS